MALWIVCSSVFTLYAISSFVLLRRPQWIHRKRRPAFLARNIAHRGGGEEMINSKDQGRSFSEFFFIGAAESIENSFVAFDQ